MNSSILSDHIPEEIWGKIILSANWLFSSDSKDFLFLAHEKKTRTYCYTEEMGCIHRRYYTVEVKVTINSLETDKENFKRNIYRFLSFGLVSRTTLRLISRLLSQRFLMEIMELLNFGKRHFGYNGRHTSPPFLHHVSWLCQNLNTFINDDFLLEYSRISEYSLHRFKSDTKFFHFYCILLKYGHNKAVSIHSFFTSILYICFSLLGHLLFGGGNTLYT
jgi:hypothetical protein